MNNKNKKTKGWKYGHSGERKRCKDERGRKDSGGKKEEYKYMDNRQEMREDGILSSDFY